MSWTTPKTDWATGELVSASDMNAIGENLAALAALPSASYTTLTDYEKHSNSYVDIDSDNLSLTITTNGGDILVHFHGAAHRAGNSTLTVTFAITVDGERQDGGISAALGSGRSPVSFTRLITGLSAGSHTFKMQWTGQHNKGMRLKSGAHFWVREI